MPKIKIKDKRNIVADNEKNLDSYDSKKRLMARRERIRAEERAREDEEGDNEREDERENRKREEEEEEREEEINESLSKIYRDGKGGKVDVSKLKIIRKHGFIFWFFNFLIISLIFIIAGLGIYYYVVKDSGTDSTAVEFKIESLKNVSAGEEFYYTINYKNLSYAALKNVTVEVSYPENFIFLDSSLPPEKENNFFRIGRVASRSDGEIKIKGKIIDKPKNSVIVLANFIYTPENFSSQFEKEASWDTLISDVGFNVSLDYQSMVLVDEQNVLDIIFNPLEKSFLGDFVFKMEIPENIKIIKILAEENDSKKDKNGESKENSSFAIKALDDNPNAWLVTGIGNKEEKIEIVYEIKEKISDNQKIKIYFEKDEAGRVIRFIEEDVTLEVMKSDLNLTLILNGSQSNGTVDFEEIMNYSIAYTNKGEATLNNVSIMAVLDSKFLNWPSLSDENMGKERGNTITWTKDEIPELEKIEINKGGIIDFSINVMPFSESDLNSDFKIISYAQYSVGSKDKLGELDTISNEEEASSTILEDSDNQSNIIISKINSDLKIKEEIRYFDENNMPVGTGPLPPQVGEKSSFKVYWTLNNNLHELRDVQVETILPEGVFWDEKNRTSVGTITYIEGEKKVVWQIGRLPITVFRADAEFSIGFTPKEDDRNKIVVLSVGAQVKAIDAKTEDALEKTTGPKTTKLEDDEIASISSDGRIR